MRNPFNPTFGDVPKIYLDSGHIADQVVDKISSSEFARSFFITGVRGSGKTALMTQIEHKLSGQSHCHLINLINDQSLLPSFVSQLQQVAGGQVDRLLNSITSVNAGNFSIKLNSSSQSGNDVLSKVMGLMKRLKQHHDYVLVTIDEVTNDSALRSLAQLFNELKRHNMPIFLIMTGLPDIILDVQNDSKLTFLLRSEKIVMSPLQKGNMAITYQEIFKCSPNVAVKMAQIVQGYSYAFQLLGYLAYEECQHHSRGLSLEDLATVKPRFLVSLFDNAYQKIFVDLSPQDQRYLVAANSHKTFTEIAEQMGVSKSYASQYRRRALARHLIVPVGYGRVKFSLPSFGTFLSATQDPDSMYYLPVE